MVQLTRANKKLCETVIAIISKCATIGTVQESSQRLTERFFFTAPVANFFGQISIKQAKKKTAAGRNVKLPSLETCCQISIRKTKTKFSVEDAGKDLYDVICSLSQFGSQSLAPDSRCLREEGHPPVV
jgi:hypothetical protein